MSRVSTWAIALIDYTHLETLKKDLKKSGLPIRGIVPTIKVIEKQFKGKVFLKEVPLLFNYGFFKIPLSWAKDRGHLDEIVEKIPAIYGWLYKPHKPKKVYNMDNLSIHGGVIVESTRYLEILRLKKLCKTRSIYSGRDIKKLKPGNFIVLKGYPFDNIPVEVLSINVKKEEVKVKLLLDTIFKEVTVKFHNVLYTVYADFNDPQTSDRNSLEAITKSLTETNNFNPDEYE